MGKRLGIAFTGGEGPAPELVVKVIGTCELSPLLAAADSGLLLAEAAGLRPHWIIGDMDSLGLPGGERRLGAYPAGCVIRHAADKDFTDTELAIALLMEKGCDETWVIGGGGGRIDHLFGIRELFEGEHFPRRWITAGEDIYCVENGSLSIKIEKGSIVSILLLGNGPWKAESAGLKWPLAPVSWKRGMTGISNVATEEKIDINVIQGRFMIVLEEIWRQF